MRRLELIAEEKIILDVSERSRHEAALAGGVSAKKFLEALKEFLSVCDELERTEHLKIFSELYLSDRGVKSGQRSDALADRLFIAERTLLRYRQRYAKMIALFLKRYGINYISDGG